ncbi:MAG TPA: DUF3761 domain-containing protein [Gemmatimonadaceae bacterium]|jgi:hypothetical protein|nr:DUF3761 domain-containing protein [Gemmatimonadaceae bacterium]
MRTHFTKSLTLFVLMTAVAAAPAVAQAVLAKTMTAVCKDGSTSTGTASAVCAGHRGIDSAATKAAKDAAKAAKAEAKAAKAKLKNKDAATIASAEAKANAAQAKANKAEDKAAHDSTGATAKCKDGTYSHSTTTQGACGRHGGIAKSLKP